MAEERWVDVADAEELAEWRLMEVWAGDRRLAVSFIDGVAGGISGRCNHVGGPLGQGRLDGDFVTCPWHQWKYHRRTGSGEPGSEGDQVPAYAVRVEAGRVLVNLAAGTRRQHTVHAPHPLARPPERATGPIRVVGISTTVMDESAPRYSGSDDLLNSALAQAAAGGAETRLIRLSPLRFRACEGYYSKSARACTWPCSITQMHADDQMDRVYEALVHWADAVIVATPIRWGPPARSTSRWPSG